MASLLKGFRDFAFKEDLIAAAVGLVMALATFELIQSIVEGLLTPLIALIVGDENFFEMAFTIGDTSFRLSDDQIAEWWMADAKPAESDTFWAS